MIEERNKNIKNEPSTILIAEDDEISFAYLDILLSNENCKIVRTRDGEETIEQVRTNPDIDLVLMDLKMPVLDGVRATMEIRRFNKAIPIIAQTAYVFESDRIEAMNAGCNDYLSKPIRKNQFLKKMQEYISLDKVK
jgi:CheY-like chemotaxis protein